MARARARVTAPRPRVVEHHDGSHPAQLELVHHKVETRQQVVVVFARARLQRGLDTPLSQADVAPFARGHDSNGLDAHGCQLVELVHEPLSVAARAVVARQVHGVPEVSAHEDDTLAAVHVQVRGLGKRRVRRRGWEPEHPSGAVGARGTLAPGACVLLGLVVAEAVLAVLEPSVVLPSVRRPEAEVGRRRRQTPVDRRWLRRPRWRAGRRGWWRRWVGRQRHHDELAQSVRLAQLCCGAPHARPSWLVVLSARRAIAKRGAAALLPISSVHHAARLQGVREVQVSVASDECVGLGALADALHWLTAEAHPLHAGSLPLRPGGL